MDGLVNQQALMISYINDFKLMMYITIASIPLIWLLRKPALQNICLLYTSRCV